MRGGAHRDLHTAAAAAALRVSGGSRAALRVHSRPQRAARPLPGGADTSRTFRTLGEQADPNPEARAGLGPGPLLTAAGLAAVAGLVEGAAGAAHRGQKGGLVDQRSHLSQPGAGVGPELRSRANRPGAAAAPPTLPARLPRVRSASAQRSSAEAVRTWGRQAAVQRWKGPGG